MTLLEKSIMINPELVRENPKTHLNVIIILICISEVNN